MIESLSNVFGECYYKPVRILEIEQIGNRLFPYPFEKLAINLKEDADE